MMDTVAQSGTQELQAPGEVVEDTVPKKEEGAIASAVGRLAAMISTEHLGTGGVAELRRAFHEPLPGPTFWRLLNYQVEGAGVKVPPGSELDWALIMGGMAIMTPRHHAQTPFGAALAKTGFSESRLRTLLATDPGTPAFRDSLFAAVRWLDQKSEPMDWRHVAYLVLHRGDSDKLTRQRRKIARDYYSYLPSDPASAS